MKRDFSININRFRKVPVIHCNDGFKLSETVAIFHYMGREKIIPYPSDFKEIAKIDEFLSWHHNSLAASTGKLFYDVWVKPFTGTELPPHGMMLNVKSPLDYVVINQSLNDLENLWLSDNKFLVGDEATFADLIAACEIMQITGFKIYKLDTQKYPKINNWLADTKEFYNPEFDQIHRLIYKLGEKYGGKPPTMGVMLFKIYQQFKKLLK